MSDEGEKDRRWQLGQLGKDGAPPRGDADPLLAPKGIDDVRGPPGGSTGPGKPDWDDPRRPIATSNPKGEYWFDHGLPPGTPPPVRWFVRLLVLAALGGLVALVWWWLR